MSFTYSSLIGTAAPADQYGITATSGGVVDTKGTYVELIDSSPTVSSLLQIGPNGQAASSRGLWDVAVGPAASEVVIVPDLVSTCGNIASTCGAFWFSPINVDIAASSRIACRWQSDGTSDTIILAAMIADRAIQGFNNPINYGVVPASSSSTQIDPGVVINTKGSYAVITESTTNPIGHFIMQLGNNFNLSPQNARWRVDLATGPGAGETIIVPDKVVRSGTNNTMEIIIPAISDYIIDLPASTRLSARAQCQITDATDRLIYIAILGMDVLASAGGETSHVF